jgi:type VI secretion system protein
MPIDNHQASLFQRLGAYSAQGHGLSCHGQWLERVASIKTHLRQLLNTRQGCSQSSPGLGLADFNGHQRGADLVSHIAADIRRTLHAYEPRLELLALHFCANAEQPQQLAFRLDCQVSLGHASEPLQIDLTLDHRRTHVA